MAMLGYGLLCFLLVFLLVNLFKKGTREMNTTLNKIKSKSPCTEGWKKLLTTLGKTKADDEPLSLITVLDSNGLDGALWCLRVLEGYDKEIRLFAVWCARQVQHLTKDERSINGLDVAEAFAHGLASKEDLDAAWAAALDAARATAWDAFSAASGDAARATAWDAAWAAARSAAWAAALDAAGATAWDAAWDAARSAAGDVARDAAWDSQEKEFRRVFGGLKNEQ